MLEEIRERSPATGSTNGCRLPSRCWEITPGPLEEQPALLPLSHLSSPLVFNSVLEALISKTPKQPDKHGTLSHYNELATSAAFLNDLQL